MNLMDVSEISRMLAEQIDTLVPQMLPAAVKEGHEWRIGSCYGEPGRSMAIHSRGPKAGVWKDFSSSDATGDALDLVAQVQFGGDKKRAVSWAKSWLGVDSLDPARLKQERAALKAKAEKNQALAEQEKQKIRRIAQAIWLNGQVDLRGSPVEQYLRGRGIELADLARPPAALRYVAELDYPPRMNNGLIAKYPAMVAAVYNGQGQHIATHRTYLERSGPYSFDKARLKDPRLTLGSYRGGFISLSRGASGKPLRDAQAGEKVAICEGIETGLTVALAKPEYRVLAALSVGNFRNLELPAALCDVLLCAENDAPGSPADKALQEAIDTFIDQGREVYIARSPVGKDFNDVIRSGSGLIVEEKLA